MGVLQQRQQVARPVQSGAVQLTQRLLGLPDRVTDECHQQLGPLLQGPVVLVVFVSGLKCGDEPPGQVDQACQPGRLQQDSETVRLRVVGRRPGCSGRRPGPGCGCDRQPAAAPIPGGSGPGHGEGRRRRRAQAQGSGRASPTHDEDAQRAQLRPGRSEPYSDTQPALPCSELRGSVGWTSPASRACSRAAQA